MEHLRKIWMHAKLPSESLGRLSLPGEAYLPSSFAVSKAASISIGLEALIASEIWRLRTNEKNPVVVDKRRACVEFRSERYARLGDQSMSLWDEVSGTYPTQDGYVRLHANFPHHRAGLLELLNCDGTKSAVSKALTMWKSKDFEELATNNGMCVAALRSLKEWDHHGAAKALAETYTDSPISITKIGDTEPKPFSQSAKTSLAGVRVLDLTRVLAGPICGRTLASHGADVVLVTAPHLPSLPNADPDTSRGKRTIQLDLRKDDDSTTLHNLAQECDVFLQAYRPGSLDNLNFSVSNLLSSNPHLIHASINAYGTKGPWGGKRGFDSLVQVATGINVAEAKAANQDTPKELPCQVLDHASGYLLAFGIMAAMHRRAIEGGAYTVEVSLAGTAKWLRELGRCEDLTVPDPSFDDVQDLLETVDTIKGPYTTVKRAPEMLPLPHYERYPMVLNRDEAKWT